VTEECASALAGYLVIYHEDEDKKGRELSDKFRKKLVNLTESLRVVPASHLWQHLDPERRTAADDLKLENHNDYFRSFSGRPPIAPLSESTGTARGGSARQRRTPVRGRSRRHAVGASGKGSQSC
jgi:hypothetical protein